LGNLLGKVPQNPGQLFILPKAVWVLHDAYPKLKTLLSHVQEPHLG